VILATDFVDMNFKLNLPTADILIPDGVSLANALVRTTHFAIGAHQDDLEFMAYHGIAECHEANDKWFLGITVTDGAGSARSGNYANYSDQQMRDVRREEQRTAAIIGKFSAVIQLGYSSATVRDAKAQVVSDLTKILERTNPQEIYLHNPLDKHRTHLEVLDASIQALRACVPAKAPRAVYGCEVWRGLDWLNDDEKILLDTGRYPELAEKLHAVFDSQIGSGKRYDLAIQGRWRANPTFSNPHQIDPLMRTAYAIDLLPLLHNPKLTISDFALAAVDRFRASVKADLT